MTKNYNNSNSEIASRIIRDGGGVTSDPIPPFYRYSIDKTESLGWVRFAHTAPYRKCGFTLAEVLITLAIVGVVAALTLPNLIANYRDRETVVKVKKVYSSLSNAYLLAKSKYGSLSEWEGLSGGTGNIDDASLFLKRLGENMNLLKNCDKDASCFKQGSGVQNYKNLGGTEERFGSGVTNFASMILADGTLVSAYVSEVASISVALIVDINGTKSPNVVGKDAFWFHLRPFTRDMIVPFGTFGDTNTQITRCLHPDSEFDTSRACSLWVIAKGNLDYLHCTGLSWNGKSKCD